MSSGGTLDRILNNIPGYGGYRDKERRRDSDRVIRENLALEYGQLADRLGQLATTLADERKIAAISVVDKPYKRLVSFVDRVRTASYGYAPLFSDAPVDAGALDQVARFDQSLADQHEVLAQQIADLEAVSPDGAAFKTRANEIIQTVEGLHDRFDKRHEVIHSGQSLPPKDIVSYLEKSAPTSTATAFRMHQNEAVSYDGVNYSISGRVTTETDRGAWRAFQLKGGVGDRWLVVSADQAEPMYWMQRVTVGSDAETNTLRIDDATYTLERMLNGKGEVIGGSGAADNQPVQFGQYRSATGDSLLFMFDWGTGTIILRGTEANPASLDVFTRET